MDATTLIQLIINGVLLGGVYALGAFGLSLIFGVSGILNLAHGEFLMLSGLALYFSHDLLGWNPFLLLALIAPFFFLLGYLFEKALIHPLYNQPQQGFVSRGGREGYSPRGQPTQVRLDSAILVTLGAALILEDLAAFATLDAQFEKTIPYFLPTLEIGGLYLPALKLLIFGLVILLAAGLFLFFKYSKTGLTIRAVSQQRVGALLAGVNVAHINAVAFGIGAFLAAIAGGFEVIHSYVAPNAGLPITLKYLSIIVMGGLGSFLGVALGGILLGLGESFVGFFNPAWGQTMAYLLLVAVLLFRPKGLLGK